MVTMNVDRSRDLKVLAPRRISGQVLTVGELLTDDQKNELSQRMLNMFFNNRWIGYADDAPREARTGGIARVRRKPHQAPEDGQRPDDESPKREDQDGGEEGGSDELHYRATEERKSPRRKVKIPKDWDDLKWNDLRSLASKLTDDPVRTKEDARKAVEGEQHIRRQLNAKKKEG